jgi:hypothetical protein
MSKTRVMAATACCLFVLAIYGWTQGMKAGLWEVTSTMTWQQSPFQGLNLPGGAMPNSPFGGGPHTTQVCVTQEQIDKYGGVPPQPGKSCQVTNIKVTPTGMTSDITCSGGPMNGTGTAKSNWTDSSHTSGHIHFTGNMQMGPQSTPVEWTIDTASVYKGANCGSVKPIVTQ